MNKDIDIKAWTEGKNFFKIKTDNKLIKLFEEQFKGHPEVRLISGGGSPRKYYRLKFKDISVIGVESEDITENRNFINLDLCLEAHGIPVPHILKVGKDETSYLLQDLGDLSLFNKLGTPEKMNFAYRALDELIKLQKLPETTWSSAVGYGPFSERLVSWDLNYFKYDFLKPYGINFDEEKLEDDFVRLTTKLTDSQIISGFMYRDFQSRNIMVKDDTLWFIDFQGARKGPVVYDAVSFIWQAKAPFTYKERKILEEYYINKFSKNEKDKTLLKNQIEIMQIFRTLQVLGAYGFRGLIEKKAHFLESLPLGIKNFLYLKNIGLLNEYPELLKICQNLELKQSKSIIPEDGKLRLSVFSFSYKEGYPEDMSGNGGGFMFDCRAIHNPGRYEEYKDLTGRDVEVVEFLENTDEASNFINHTIDLVKPSIGRYLMRNFTSLQVGFGCTGGRHRSVYCAERFAREIKRLYPEIIVEIKHREQGISEEL